MDVADRVALVRRNADELITEEELERLLASTEHPRAYIGFEPSGRLTVGHLVCARKMRDLVEAGCELTVFLADWHAWINEKLGGSLDRIRAAGEYMQEAYQALGVHGGRVRWRWASELQAAPGYWARVVRVAKRTSLERTRRAMTILGRGEEESTLDTAKLFYPSMQVADIFELPVEIAYAGRDQRRAHVLAREVAHREGWPVPVALHTPLIPSLRGGGRMDPAADEAEGKMSKSDPTSAIVIPSDPETIRKRVQGAFCPPKELERNPVTEIARHVLFPWEGRVLVDRAEKHGGRVEFTSIVEFDAAYRDGRLHPDDLKKAVSAALDRLMAPASEHFAAHPGTLERMEAPGARSLDASPGRA